MKSLATCEQTRSRNVQTNTYIPKLGLGRVWLTPLMREHDKIERTGDGARQVNGMKPEGSAGRAVHVQGD